MKNYTSNNEKNTGDKKTKVLMGIQTKTGQCVVIDNLCNDEDNSDMVINEIFSSKSLIFHLMIFNSLFTCSTMINLTMQYHVGRFSTRYSSNLKAKTQVISYTSALWARQL